MAELRQPNSSPFATKPKTRRHLTRGAFISGTRAVQFMEHLWDTGLKKSCAYETLKWRARDKLEELKEKWLRLAWTEHVPAFTPIELRKRQLFDMMQFLGVPEDVQNHVKILAGEWGKPEDFDKGLPMIRWLLEGKSVNAADLEASIPDYQLQLQDGKAYIGTTEWQRQRVRQPSQQVVEIETLTNHLQEGWRFVSTLPNGKCVIERAR